jgi:hypothetical protein
MRTQLHPPSAKIYAFPAGGRAGLKEAQAPSEELAYAAFGSGWYHEAAIEEVETPRQRVAPGRLHGDRH